MKLSEISQLPQSMYGIAIIVCGNDETAGTDTAAAVEAANNAMFDSTRGFVNAETSFQAWNGGYCYQFQTHHLRMAGRFTRLAILARDDNEDWQITNLAPAQIVETAEKIANLVDDAYEAELANSERDESSDDAA